MNQRNGSESKGHGMDINDDLMAKYDTALVSAAARVKLGDGAVEARVAPAAFTQLNALAGMVGDAVNLRDLASVVMGQDRGDAEAATRDEALLARLLDLLTRLPELHERWVGVMQPNTDVDLTRLRLFDFAQVAVAFLVGSVKGSAEAGWLGLGKSLAGVLGPKD